MGMDFQSIKLIAESEITGLDIFGYQQAVKRMCQDVVDQGRGFIRWDYHGGWRHVPLHEIDKSAPAAGGE